MMGSSPLQQILYSNEEYINSQSHQFVYNTQEYKNFQSHHFVECIRSMFT